MGPKLLFIDIETAPIFRARQSQRATKEARKKFKFEKG